MSPLTERKKGISKRTRLAVLNLNPYAEFQVANELRQKNLYHNVFMCGVGGWILMFQRFYQILTIRPEQAEELQYTVGTCDALKENGLP